MALMLKPALILTVPMIFLLVHLDNYYGKAALPIGKPAIVTVQAAGRIGANTPAPSLEPPPGVAVETPAVRILDQGQFSWRIRPLEATDGALDFNWEGAQWQKSVASGPEHRYLASRKVSSWTDAFLSAGENRLETSSVAWVDVSYPTANIEFAGLDLHWLVWFFLISIVAAYLLKGYFGVVI
jgi:hypothetical protein